MQRLLFAIARINVEARVASLVRQQNPTTLDKIKDFAGKVDDVNSILVPDSSFMEFLDLDYGDDFREHFSDRDFAEREVH